MKIKVVGVEKRHLDFENNNHERVIMDGRQLHYSYQLQDEGSIGVGCNNCFLSDSKFGAIDFQIGDVYWADSYRGKLLNFEKVPKV